MPAMSYRTFTLATCALALGLVALVGAVNCLVDPYRMNGRVLVRHFNQAKPESEPHERLYKAAMIAARAPSVLALGTSRTEVGIGMAHAGWQGAPQERYNAALGGANLYEMFRYFEHAQQVQPLRQVVIGLDFLAFNACKPNGPDLDEALLRRDGRAGDIAVVVETAKITLSVDALASSARTVLCNVRNCEAPYLDSGEENPAHFEKGWSQAHSQRDAFLVYARRAMTDLNFPPPLRCFALTGPDGASPVRYLRRIVDIAYRDGIDLRLFISPAHAWQWEALRAAGLWEAFEGWKRGLVGLLDDAARAHPQRPAIVLWDFADYSSISTEAVPAPEAVRARMRGYWESSHYTRETGDLVLDRVLGDGPLPPRPPADFGVRLDARNLEAYLAAVRERAAQYRRSHPDDIAQIEALAVQTATLRHPPPAPKAVP